MRGLIRLQIESDILLRVLADCTSDAGQYLLADMKYDDATWHSGGDFPDDLPAEAGGTHAAIFLAWALLSGLAGELHVEEPCGDLELLRRREISPGEFFFRACDGKFTDEDLNDEGNAFARAYFDFETGKYLYDYDRTLTRGLPSQYHVKDNWENFDRMRPILDQRLASWRAGAA